MASSSTRGGGGRMSREGRRALRATLGFGENYYYYYYYYYCTPGVRTLCTTYLPSPKKNNAVGRQVLNIFFCGGQLISYRHGVATKNFFRRKSHTTYVYGTV